MRFRKLKKQAGYTLVEILIASTIFVSVVGMGMATYTSASGFQSKSAVIRETNQAARYAMDRIVSDIRSADGSVRYSVNSIYDILNGFSFMTEGAGSGLHYNIGANSAVNASTAPLTPLSLYLKGEEPNCDIYIKQMVYYSGVKPTNNLARTILKDVRYIDPVTYSPTGVPATCPAVVGVDLLSDRAQLYDDTVDSFNISGNDGRIICTNSLFTSCIPITVSPKVIIKMKVKSVGADLAKAEESRIIELNTTVVPRNVPI